MSTFDVLGLVAVFTFGAAIVKISVQILRDNDGWKDAFPNVFSVVALVFGILVMVFVVVTVITEVGA